MSNSAFLTDLAEDLQIGIIEMIGDSSKQCLPSKKAQKKLGIIDSIQEILDHAYFSLNSPLGFMTLSRSCDKSARKFGTQHVGEILDTERNIFQLQKL